MRGIIFYVPEELATTPAEGHCFVNSWWTVHPEKGVAFYADRRRSPFLDPGDQDEPAPQCNRNEETARFLQRKFYPDCETKLIPVVYLRPAIAEMHRQRKLLHEQKQPA